MAKKIYAKCTNIEGDCKVALTGKVLDFPAGTSNEDLLCPECNELLFYPVKVGTDWGKIVRKAAIIALPIIIIGGGALWAFLPENDNLNPEDTSIHNQDNGKTTVLPDTSNKSDNDSAKPTTAPAENTDPAPPPPKPSPSNQKSYGEEVAGSRRVKDCDLLYQIWDGKGDKIDQIKRLSGCDCGTEHKFGDGYNYRIECSGGTKRAILVN